MAESKSYTAVQFVEWAMQHGHYPVVDVYQNFLKYKQYEKEVKSDISEKLRYVEE